ncbi:hypothetical protein PPERSA_05716 [Pseudocohnilembus persalinus]|uniref:Uncharacterized protein n=1 Tax=Pseudocohnilembus persalinus TaxID=266149 RepID=A0A0V0QIL6_PSEPJ|nr:hypothetical protein PPERSA_05716 [Pseudocohnilembus persalinus]|eukprot:KRX01877.1 hypothetical protein PPERSA_05716 [Pseudocohnilembus persalinus]
MDILSQSQTFDNQPQKPKRGPGKTHRRIRTEFNLNNFYVNTQYEDFDQLKQAPDFQQLVQQQNISDIKSQNQGNFISKTVASNHSKSNSSNSLTKINHANNNSNNNNNFGGNQASNINYTINTNFEENPTQFLLQQNKKRQINNEPKNVIIEKLDDDDINTRKQGFLFGKKKNTHQFKSQSQDYQNIDFYNSNLNNYPRQYQNYSEKNDTNQEQVQKNPLNAQQQLNTYSNIDLFDIQENEIADLVSNSSRENKQIQHINEIQELNKESDSQQECELNFQNQNSSKQPTDSNTNSNNNNNNNNFVFQIQENKNNSQNDKNSQSSQEIIINSARENYNPYINNKEIKDNNFNQIDSNFFQNLFDQNNINKYELQNSVKSAHSKTNSDQFFQSISQQKEKEAMVQKFLQQAKIENSPESLLFLKKLKEQKIKQWSQNNQNNLNFNNSLNSNLASSNNSQINNNNQQNTFSNNQQINLQQVQKQSSNNLNSKQVNPINQKIQSLISKAYSQNLNTNLKQKPIHKRQKSDGTTTQSTQSYSKLGKPKYVTSGQNKHHYKSQSIINNSNSKNFSNNSTNSQNNIFQQEIRLQQQKNQALKAQKQLNSDITSKKTQNLPNNSKMANNQMKMDVYKIQYTNNSDNLPSQFKSKSNSDSNLNNMQTEQGEIIKQFQFFNLKVQQQEDNISKITEQINKISKEKTQQKKDNKTSKKDKYEQVIKELQEKVNEQQNTINIQNQELIDEQVKYERKVLEIRHDTNKKIIELQKLHQNQLNEIELQQEQRQIQNEGQQDQYQNKLEQNNFCSNCLQYKQKIQNLEYHVQNQDIKVDSLQKTLENMNIESDYNRQINIQKEVQKYILEIENLKQQVYQKELEMETREQNYTQKLNEITDRIQIFQNKFMGTERQNIDLQQQLEQYRQIIEQQNYKKLQWKDVYNEMLDQIKSLKNQIDGIQQENKCLLDKFTIR